MQRLTNSLVLTASQLLLVFSATASFNSTPLQQEETISATRTNTFQQHAPLQYSDWLQTPVPIASQQGLLHKAGAYILSFFSPLFGATFPEQEKTALQWHAVSKDNDTLQYPTPTPTFTTISSEWGLPHELRVYILSFLTQQKDLLRIGAVSKSWREAASQVWKGKVLNLSNRPLTAADYKVLAGGIFPRLRLNNVKLNEEGMSILATCSHLRTVELKHNRLYTKQALTSLLLIPTLEKINLGFNCIIINPINPGAEYLNREDAKTFAQLLKVVPITKLDLHHNYIGDEGIIAIAQAIKIKTSITALNLRGNNIGTAGAKALAETLKELPSITKLYLGCNFIDNEGATALAQAIKQTSLKKLELFDNDIGDEGAKALAQALKTMTAITTFDLKSNRVGDEGAKALVQALNSITSITAVRLNGNQIGDEGVKALAQTLLGMPSITAFSINNPFGDEGRRALEELKSSRPSLNLNY